jgi:hypothetical protein
MASKMQPFVMASSSEDLRVRRDLVGIEGVETAVAYGRSICGSSVGLEYVEQVPAHEHVKNCQEEIKNFGIATSRRSWFFHLW